MIISELFEAPQLCPECGGISFSDLILAEKKDACYHKVKASAKVWPSAYASGRLVQCRKKGAANYGNKSESVAEGFLDEAVGMMIKGAAISGPDDQDIADRIAAKTGGRVDSGSRGHHILITYPTTQHRAMAAVKIRKMFPGIELYKSGGNRNAIDEQGMAEQSTAQDTVGGINTGGAKDFTKKALGKVGRAVMPTLGFTDAAERLSNKDYAGAGIAAAAGGIGLIPAWPAQLASGGLELVNMTRDEANALGGYDKLAKEISKNFTPATDPSYLPENPAQSEGLVSGAKAAYDTTKAAYNRGKDFVKYLRRNDPVPLNPNASQDIATQRSVGGKEIPSFAGPGKAVSSTTVDNALVRLGGKDVSTTSGPAVTVQKRGSEYEPLAAEVPAYVRKGLPDPVTVPKPGTKPKITVRPGETVPQAIERTRAEQEFGNFLKGQGGQKFGTPSAAQTSGSDQVPTIKLPDGSLIVDPSRLSPSGQYGRLDKIARDDEAAVDAMVKKARENAEARDAAQAAKEKQLGLEPGSLRPKSQYEKEQISALRSEEEKLGLLPGSLNPKPKKPTTPPAEKSSTLGKIGKGLGYAAGAYGAAELGSQALDQVKEAKPRKEPEVDYDDEYDAMVARVRKLAGLGPMKTVYDPAKRQYRNMPTAQQPKK
jgi:hypothetical protein